MTLNKTTSPLVLSEALVRREDEEERRRRKRPLNTSFPSILSCCRETLTETISQPFPVGSPTASTRPLQKPVGAVQTAFKLPVHWSTRGYLIRTPDQRSGYSFRGRSLIKFRRPFKVPGLTGLKIKADLYYIIS